MATTRAVIHIDEEKCDGCGLCVPACEEGALKIVDGKARLVGEIYCDGLGNCLGECPTGALTVERREAEEFSPSAVEELLARRTEEPAAPAGGCPGSRAVRLAPQESAASSTRIGADSLANWPVQLHLMPAAAPYLDGADVLLAADCTAFAAPAEYALLMEGRVVVIGCPKLDDGRAYLDKLTEMLRERDIRGITIAYMEVPCCHSLLAIADAAIRASGRQVPLRKIELGIRGNVVEPGETD